MTEKDLLEEIRQFAISKEDWFASEAMARDAMKNDHIAQFRLGKSDAFRQVWKKIDELKKKRTKND